MGRDPSAIAKLEASGNATPEMLVAIARACGQSPVKFLIVAGLLTEDDSQVPTVHLSGQEEELVLGFQRLPECAQELALGAIQGTLWSANPR